jgi:hypothetical protein
MHKVRFEGGSVLQNGVEVATVHSGWGMGLNREFLIRARKGNGEAKNFLKFMLSRMTVAELAAGVALSSPVEFGAFHGWQAPHFATWVKNGDMTQEKANESLRYWADSHAKKVAA